MSHFPWEPPVSPSRVASALQHVQVCIVAHATAPYPKPFGDLQLAIRLAKDAGASCDEILCTIKHADED